MTVPHIQLHRRGTYFSRTIDRLQRELKVGKYNPEPKKPIWVQPGEIARMRELRREKRLSYRSIGRIVGRSGHTVGRYVGDIEISEVRR